MSVRVPLREAAGSLAKASTPQPFSTSKTSNWVARVGGLPDYIQHVAHGILRSDPGGGESGAIQKAIGVVKNWASGGGKVDANTRAAAAKAVAEWEAKKAANKAKGAVREQWIEEADRYRASVVDERLARDGALLELAVFSGRFGMDGVVELLAAGPLAEASSWTPTMKATACAPGEKSRHEVYDGGQHVGTVTSRKPYSPSDPERWSVKAVNGQDVGGMGLRSKGEAVDALRRHLASAPARVMDFPTAGKYLVARPSSYGETTYTSFPNEIAARHAAGLPAAPTQPEVDSKVQQIAEALTFDLMTLSGVDVQPLRRAQEARRRDPFDLVAEAFHPGEPRGFHGRWIPGLSTRPRELDPSMRRVAFDAAEGGGGAARLKLRRMKPLALERMKDSIGSGAWSSRVAGVTKGLMAGRLKDTEAAYSKKVGGRRVYSPERQALHEEIFARLLQGKQPHDSGRRAIFTAGGPAAGKSELLRAGDVVVPGATAKGEENLGLDDAVHINPDVVRAMLPEYQQMVAAGRRDASGKTHEESSHIAKLAMKMALQRGHHIVVDGVGDSESGKFAGKIKQAMGAGYDTSVTYATKPVEDAWRFAEARGRKRGRFVDEKVLREAHRDVSRRFPEIQALKGAHVRIFDTTTHGVDKLIYEKPAGRAAGDKLHIKDARLFGRFLAKANAKA